MQQKYDENGGSVLLKTVGDLTAISTTVGVSNVLLYMSVLEGQLSCVPMCKLLTYAVYNWI